MADFSVNNQGNIFLLTAKSEAGQEWIAEYIGGDVQMFGDAIVVDHRYISDIVQGIMEDGLTVE